MAPVQIQFHAARAPAVPTADERLHALLLSLERRLRFMEQRPGMYAVEPETLERLFFHVVETRQHVLRPRALAQNPRETLDAWIIFAHFVAGKGGVGPLHAVLRDHGQLDHLPRLLGDAGRWIGQEHPPEGRLPRAPGAHRILWVPFSPRCLDCGTLTAFRPGRGQVWRAPKTTRWSQKMPACTWPKVQRVASRTDDDGLALVRETGW